MIRSRVAACHGRLMRSRFPYLSLNSLASGNKSNGYPRFTNFGLVFVLCALISIATMWHYLASSLSLSLSISASLSAAQQVEDRTEYVDPL